MSDKAQDDTIKPRGEELELSEEALEEMSGGGIIIEDRQGSTLNELRGALTTDVTSSKLDVSEGGYKSTLRVTRDAEKGS